VILWVEEPREEGSCQGVILRSSHWWKPGKLTAMTMVGEGQECLVEYRAVVGMEQGRDDNRSIFGGLGMGQG
jgi:hypothetical protein